MCGGGHARQPGVAWLSRSVDAVFEGLGVLPHETKQAQIAAACFTCILASYFIAVPLRDEMGVLLGTSTLPKLVGSSVLFSIVSQAATSSLLEQAGMSKPVAMRRFFQYLSACIFVFAVALIVTFELPDTAQLTAWSHNRSLLAAVDAGSDVPVDPPSPPQPPPEAGTAQDLSPPLHNFNVSTGDASLSTARRTLFIVFYLWTGVQNLLAGSVMWARCADVFSAASAQRVFGVLAAAATLGQLLGALGVQVLCRSTSQSMPLWLQVLLLGISAACMYGASVLVRGLEAPPLGPPGKHAAEPLLIDIECAAMDSPRSMHTPARTARLSLERRNSSGAARTLPSPSAAAAAAAGMLPPIHPSSNHSKHSTLANGAQYHNGHSGGSAAANGAAAGTSSGLNGGDVRRPPRAPPRRHNGAAQSVWRKAAAVPLRSVTWIRKSVEAFAQIARSALLLHLSAHLVAGYVVSSLLYFARSRIFAAALSGSASRLRWFSAVHAVSGALILGLQLLATGSAIRWAGVSVALVSVPLTCAMATAVLALRPEPVVLLLAEAARKVVSYSFAKPAREMLFTQVSAEAKYKSKLMLDTVVQRCGDTLGAAAFSTLEAYDASSACLAAGCCGLSLLWAVVAYTLGLRFDGPLRRAASVPHGKPQQAPPILPAPARGAFCSIA
eukprot:jgi/Ulvmu1/8539/UM044_0073.1